MQKRTLWVTQTAIFTALLVVVQLLTSPLGNTLVTGTLVNSLLLVSTALCGLPSGICVAILSPILAKFLGIGPLWSIIPFILIANLALVTLWHFLRGGKNAPLWRQCLALLTAAVCKFALLYFGVAKLAVEIILKLPQPQAAVVATMFSVPQLVTAILGSVLALIILKTLSFALPNVGNRE